VSAGSSCKPSAGPGVQEPRRADGGRLVGGHVLTDKTLDHARQAGMGPLLKKDRWVRPVEIQLLSGSGLCLPDAFSGDELAADQMCGHLGISRSVCSVVSWESAGDAIFSATIPPQENPLIIAKAGSKTN